MAAEFLRALPMRAALLRRGVLLLLAIAIGWLVAVSPAAAGDRSDEVFNTAVVADVWLEIPNPSWTPIDDVAPIASDDPNPAEQAVSGNESARARALLETLPEKQRLSVSLRIDDGLSFREIGEMIGSSEGAARVNYFHGIRRLRELMQ